MIMLSKLPAAWIKQAWRLRLRPCPTVWSWSLSQEWTSFYLCDKDIYRLVQFCWLDYTGDTPESGQVPITACILCMPWSCPECFVFTSKDSLLKCIYPNYNVDLKTAAEQQQHIVNKESCLETYPILLVLTSEFPTILLNKWPNRMKTKLHKTYNFNLLLRVQGRSPLSLGRGGYIGLFPACRTLIRRTASCREMAKKMNLIHIHAYN